MSERKSFEGWAIVELFGHNMIAGRISEQSVGGSPFVRVDVPNCDGVLGFTKFYGGAAIYAITPADKIAVVEAVKRLAVRPVSPWVVPDLSRELPAEIVDS